IWVGGLRQRGAGGLQVAADVRTGLYAVVVRGRDRGAGGDHAAGPEQRQVHDRLLVYRVRDRSAHVHVVERCALDVEVDAAEVGGQAAHHLDVGVRLQDLDVGRGYVLDEVGVAGLYGGRARGGVRIELERDAVQVWQLVAVRVRSPVVLVALQDHAGLRDVLDEPEGSGAHDDLLQVTVLGHDVFRNDDVQGGSQLREERAERLGQGHHDRALVWRLDVRDHREVVCPRRGDGRVLYAVDREHYVRRLQRLAVVERNSVAEV